MAIKKHIREIVYNKCKGHCAYCGENIEYKQMQVDHIIPQAEYLWFIKNQHKIPEYLKHLTEADVDHIDNLLPACRICNKWKNTFGVEMFRREVFEQVKRCNDYSSNYRMAKRYGLIKETIKPIVFYFEMEKIFNN